MKSEMKILHFYLVGQIIRTWCVGGNVSPEYNLFFFKQHIFPALPYIFTKVSHIIFTILKIFTKNNYTDFYNCHIVPYKCIKIKNVKKKKKKNHNCLFGKFIGIYYIIFFKLFEINSVPWIYLAR